MPEQSNNPKLVTIFHSYAHQDSVLRDAVEKALAGVKHVKNFHDDSTLPGEEWEKKVLPQLDAADIVVLHISPDFVYSSWCNAEMNRALENMKKHRSRVIPVHLRPFYWPDRPIKHLQALPEDAKPVTEWPNQDAAFVSV